MARLVAKVLGVVFILVGIIGFLGGHDHIGAYSVNVAHNAVHLLSGIVALICAFKGEKAAQGFCLIFGVVYLLVCLLGLLNVTAVINLLNLNEADNMLHLMLGGIFVVAGLLSRIKDQKAAKK